MTGEQLVVCPICRKVIHVHSTEPIRAVARVGSGEYKRAADLTTAMMLAAEEAHREAVLAAERSCQTHFAEQHAWRLLLWRRYRWNWAVTRRWPWSRPANFVPFSFKDEP